MRVKTQKSKLSLVCLLLCLVGWLVDSCVVFSFVKRIIFCNSDCASLIVDSMRVSLPLSSWPGRLCVFRKPSTAVETTRTVRKDMKFQSLSPISLCLLLLLRSQPYLWDSLFLVRLVRMWPFYNLTIEVVTFCLRGWCVLGVFLFPVFTRLGLESVQWNAVPTD